MKVSEQWLREWVDPPVSTQELAEQLTLAGLEVEGVHDCRRDLDRVVVGRVRSLSPHPENPALNVCRVDGGGDPVTVVCGAPGVRTGGYYPLALPGAALAGRPALAAAQIQGVASDGMLCSAAELGLGEEAGELLALDDAAAPGTALAAALGLDDAVLELSLTPNRGDCLSMAGVAREVGVLNDMVPGAPAGDAAAADSEQVRDIVLEAPEGCPRYCGRVIDGVDVNAVTPVWIAERLRRAGVRRISAVVDITNYVMLELGQPMHAFDDARLAGAIRVRFARSGERLQLLDGRECRPDPDMLLITDDSGPVALAGIMGGLPTAVGDATRRVFLESAFFAPETVMGRARRLGLQTDASQRFERGVDTGLQLRALERATLLIQRYCGGEAGPAVDCRAGGFPPAPRTVTLRAERLALLLGIELPPDRVQGILERLGLRCRAGGAGVWEVQVPGHRFDIGIEADLVEEVARIHGFRHISGAALPGGAGMHPPGPESVYREWRRVLVDRGYQEAITYSFVDRDLQERMLGDAPAVGLVNPISSDMAVMRRSQWVGLLGALRFNLARQQIRLRLFELGRVFDTGEGLSQERTLAGVICGENFSEQWDRPTESSDFYDLKGDVEALLAVSRPGARPLVRAADHRALHPGQSARIFFENQHVGVMGAVHPRVLRALDISVPVYAFELRAGSLGLARPVPRYREVSRFPVVRRDLALLVDREIPAGEVVAAAREASGGLLTNLELFDVYEGEGIDLGKKSLALGLTFQKTSSTLIEEEVEEEVGRILAALRENFRATLRD